MDSPVDKLVEDAQALLDFLDQYPPHFSDGKSMYTDIHGYTDALRESAAALEKRVEPTVEIPEVGDVDPAELDALEAQSKKLFQQCGEQSGMPGYPALDSRRKRVLAKLEKLRTLTRWEYINLYGYNAWRAFCDEHGLTEDHPLAEKPWFRNYYECPDDGETWEDEHSAMCNDHCPKCNAEIEPYKSDTLDYDTGVVLEEGTDCRETV